MGEEYKTERMFDFLSLPPKLLISTVLRCVNWENDKWKWGWGTTERLDVDGYLNLKNLRERVYEDGETAEKRRDVYWFPSHEPRALIPTPQNREKKRNRDLSKVVRAVKMGCRALDWLFYGGGWAPLYMIGNQEVLGAKVPDPFSASGTRLRTVHLDPRFQ